MLLRSSSTPILNSWLPNSTGSSPEPENLPQLAWNRSVTLINVEDSIPGRSVAARSLRDSDLINDSETSKNVKGRIKRSGMPRPVKLKEKEDEMQRLLSNSGLGDSGVAAEEEGCLAVAEEEEEEEEKEKKKKKERVLQTLVGGNGGSVVGGVQGFIGGDGSGFGSNSRDSNSWRGTDAYYRKMIEANPGNALLLSNYAKFLKEVNTVGQILRTKDILRSQ